MIAVIGAGTMGNGIAHVFAQHHFLVNLIDTDPTALAKAVNTIEKNIDRQIAKGTLAANAKEAILLNITTHTHLQTGIVDADLIIEAATENSTIKKKIFVEMDSYAKSNCLLAAQIAVALA